MIQSGHWLNEYTTDLMDLLHVLGRLVLLELRQAGGGGLPQARRRLMETVVPQMVRWLPAEEADRVKQAFGEALAA